MRFYGTNEIKQLNGHERKLPLKLIGNNFDESRLPFMSSDQQYFQAQYHYRFISFHSHRVPFCPVYFLLNGNLTHACLHPSFQQGLGLFVN
jgi:hypothetical protein